MKRARFLQYGFLAIDAAFFGIDYEVREPAPFKTIGSSAVVEVRGPLTQHPCWMWDDYESIRDRAAKAFASNTANVVLKLDTPGGEVGGVFDLARSLRKMAERSGKPLFAYADGKALSSGYALACAAERIVISETSSAGSIGCIATMIDLTARDKIEGISVAIVTSGKRKADGNPHTPLTDDALAACQGNIDAIASIFHELVADVRKMTPGAVRALEAATFIGKDAVRVGLVDAVQPFDDFIAEIGSGKTTAARGGATEGTKMSDYTDALAKLRASAKGDGDEAKKAKAALKAMGEDEEEKKDDDKKEEKAEGDKKDDEKKDDEKKDDEKKEEKAEAAGTDLALASKVQSLTARLDAKEEADERKTLMASRTDLDADVVKFLDRSPLSVVRDAVKTFPRGKPKGQVAAAVAALDSSVQATRGEGEVDTTTATRAAGGRGGYSKGELDEEMGLAPPVSAIKHDGTRLFLGVLTPEQSRAITAARASEAAAKAATSPPAVKEGR